MDRTLTNVGRTAGGTTAKAVDQGYYPLRWYDYLLLVFHLLVELAQRWREERDAKRTRPLPDRS